jgi:N-carbamoyl-L-amino-acid hydrolase
LTIELRDLSNDKIHKIFDIIEKEMKVIEEETGVSISYAEDHTNISALMDDRIKSLLEESAIELGLRYRMMPSGAGHDAQAMARIAPTGMIFVPSRDGISHSPLEYTSTDDIAAGASVMYHTILKLDKRLK